MQLSSTSGVVFFSLIAAATFGCAQGSSIDAGLGGAGGTGSSTTNPAHAANGSTTNTAGPTTGTGTPSSTGALATSSGTGPSTTTGTGTSTTSTTTTSTTTAATTVATTAVTTVAVSTSTGTVTTCDPMNPLDGCTAADHCLPTDTGTPTCTPPIGAGTQYSGCLGREDCDGPFECVDVGDPFNLPCCLRWCVSDGDCAGDTCSFFTTPLFVGATEYGVCYDGGPGC